MPWRRRDAIVRPATIRATTAFGLPSQTVSAHGEVIPADETLEQKVDRLFARTDRLDVRLNELRQKHGKEIDSLRQQIGDLDARLRKADDDIREHAERLALDTVPLQMRGLILVGVGTLIAAFPGIAGW